MSKKTNPRVAANKTRAKRIRKKFRGTAERPRLAVYKSINHVYAQLIDDVNRATLTGVSTMKGSLNISGNMTDKAKAVGEAIARKAQEKGITDVVFDRSGYLYHGRIKALAEAARKAGLKF